MANNIIQAEYETLDQVSGKFDLTAENTEEMLRTIEASLAPLVDGGWKGMGSDAFFAEMKDEVLPALKRLLTALENASYTTRQIVEVLYSAEQEAANQFNIDTGSRPVVGAPTQPPRTRPAEPAPTTRPPEPARRTTPISDE